MLTSGCPQTILSIKYQPQSIKVKKIGKDLAVWRGPGNSTSLWSEVKIAKDMSVADVPELMDLGNAKNQGNNLSQSFADFFKYKWI